MVALAAWGGVTFLYCLYLLFTQGFVAGNILPALFVVAVIAGGAVWGWNWYRDDRDCKYAMTFYGDLAMAPLGERAALIAANRDVVANPTFCRNEALFYWFGDNKYGSDELSEDEERQRLATFELLLDEGLPPDDDMVWKAVNDADPGLFALLMTRRVALNRNGATWDPAPTQTAFNIVQAIETDPDSVYYDFAPAHRAMLDVLIANGVDLCARDSFGKTLGERMAAKDVIGESDLPDCP